MSSTRAEIFEQVRARYIGLLTSILWKLTSDRELFTEAMQYALLGIWQHLGKLDGKKAHAYIYRIALSANSKAWRNRIGKDGQLSTNQPALSAVEGNEFEKSPDDKLDRDELAMLIRREISRLPYKQANAIVMRYLEQQDYQAIAGKLSCTEASARSHVSKALAALKSKLAALAYQES
jgi:RNA polymerase sigma factor (sigma-70 family)